MQVDEGLSARQALAAVAVGAVGALGLSRLAGGVTGEGPLYGPDCS
ncbi:hypothetical protein I552_0318 [Mycobacterium xenopi 3993]|nr:hypothetical protein I552_0318 [Mycobacterium xenopi 3993]